MGPKWEGNPERQTVRPERVFYFFIACPPLLLTVSDPVTPFEAGRISLYTKNRRGSLGFLTEGHSGYVHSMRLTRFLFLMTPEKCDFRA